MMMTDEQQLARKIGLPLVTLYGLGTILGAGIYVLIGKVSSAAGFLAPLSFLLAALIAWVTAMSYSQLVVLFPKSAGEAVYVDKGFGIKWLTFLVGILIMLTGIVSAATLANGFIGYFKLFFPIIDSVGIITVVVLLGGLACWGIAESLTAAALITLIEISGLAIVVAYCGDTLFELPARVDELFIPASSAEVIGVLAGAFLAFYAFIGFEDMVNVVEEVKEPSNTMPKAILLAIVVSTILYMLIAVVAILSLPLDQLTASEAPLALVLETKSQTGAKVIAAISVFAIVNGVLIQIIMASRVLYGMSTQHLLPSLFSKVNQRTKTPVLATIVISVLVMVFSLWLPLVTLAKLTSFIILTIFSLVNLALWKISKDDKYQEQLTLRYYPLLGALLCLGLLASQLLS